MFCTCHDTPAGRLLLTSDGTSVTGLGWDDMPEGGPHNCALLDELRRELDAYFARKRTRFDLPVCTDNCTPFVRTVLQTLQSVPCGAWVTYGELARMAGYPGAARAVGGAVHRNPVAILIPCHRVLASGGHIGGFAPGTDIKKILLDLEGIPYRE